MIERTITTKSHPRDTPWYLNGSERDGIRRLTRPLLHAVALLTIGQKVLRSWWRSPHAPDPVINRSFEIQTMLTSIFRLPIWIGGAIIAGFIGAQFATATSAMSLARDIGGWSEVVFWAWVLSTFIWWCNFVGRLAHAIDTWSQRTSEMESLSRRHSDVSLFGYEIPAKVRKQFRIKSVAVVAPLTFFLLAMILVDVARP